MAEPSPSPDRSEAVRGFEEGIRCLGTGHTTEARRHFEEALKVEPALAEARYNLALLCARSGDQASALALLRECCRQRPSMAEAHAALGGLLLRSGAPQAALPILRQAHALAPASPVAPNNLGLCLLALGQPEEAETSFRAALEAAPGNPDVASNLGSALHAQERNREAATLLSIVVQQHPQHERAHLNLALALLSDARYTEAWPHFEARCRLGLAGSGRRFPGKPWNGRDDLTGHTLLVHAEQGLGDSLQFSRFLPQLITLGARLHLELQAPLLPLFEGLHGLDGLHEAGKSTPPCDFHCALPSLPHLLNCSATTLPPPNPGLHVDPALETLWSTRLPPPSGRPRVGIAWSGSPLHPNDQRRSVPVPALAQTLLGHSLQLVSLQLEPKQQDLIHLQQTIPLLNLAPEIRHFADSAALLKQLDLIITVDTAWAHLAGMLGKPAWLLLSKPGDWRWSAALPAPGWYPGVRYFRQTIAGDWSAPLLELCQALRSFTSQG